jgi:hypothetical protein
LKGPIPLTSDPARERFINTLLKHDIDVDEYCSIYAKSSIPLQNNLSKLAVDTFERNACFVNQYSKYPTELGAVVNKQIQNGSISKNEEGVFSIQNQDVFISQFDGIENLVLGARTESTTSKHQPVNNMNQETRSIIPTKHTTAAGARDADDTEKENCETRHHSSSGKSIDQQDADIAGKQFYWICGCRASLSVFLETSLIDAFDVSSDIDNSSVTTFEKQLDVQDESLDILTQQTVRAGTY